MARLSRRRVLALAATLSLAGCLGDPSEPNAGESSVASRSTPPEYDCAAADRPEPDAPDREDAVEPTTYPTRPESLSDDDAVADYVEAYERAYRRNLLVERSGEDLVGQSASVREVRTYDAPDGAAVARVRYTYAETVREPDGTAMVGDSPTVFASYYVGDSVVVRAADTGRREDEDALEPDPWETGKPVSCLA